MIQIIGDYFSSSGYGIHTRNLARAINKLHPVKVMANLNMDMLRFLKDDELEMIKRTGEPDINLIITMPMFWKQYLTDKRNWVFLVWEGDKIPQSFLEECRNPRIEYIFVPSEHTKRALQDIASENDCDLLMGKVRVMPHGCNKELFYPKELKHERFTFFVNKGWRSNEDRGGTQYAVKAYLEEFTDKDKVLLLIKVNPAYGIPNVDKLINDLKPKHRTDFAPIQVIPNNVPYEQLNDLYNLSDCFVSPTRAEAFNLGCVEAICCGKPVISTNYGGQTDYLNEVNATLIDYKLEPVKHEIMYEGINWAIPNVNELKKAMRKEFNNPRNIPINDYSWEVTARKIVNLIVSQSL